MDEILCDDIQYYNRIPVKELARKQEARFNKNYNRTKNTVCKEPLIKETPYDAEKHRQKEELDNLEQYQRELNIKLIYIQLEIKHQEERVENNRKEIEIQAAQIAENNALIDNQNEIIKNKEERIEELTKEIDTLSPKSEYIASYLQEQYKAYEYNQQQIQKQADYINSVNATCAQQVSVLESIKAQIAHHSHMLESFTTMISNPQFVSQLATSLSSASPIPQLHLQPPLPPPQPYYACPPTPIITLPPTLISPDGSHYSAITYNTYSNQSDESNQTGQYN
jgi:hypothetical protein